MKLSLHKRIAGRRRAKKWRDNHPDAVETVRQRSHAKHPDTYRFSCLKNAAKTRGRQCDITLDEYRTLYCEPCHYCGGDLPANGHGLDRIDPTIGYIMKNVRPCCTDCNIAKNDMTDDEFRKWSIRLYRKWANQELARYDNLL
jgi:hypothetical protein